MKALVTVLFCMYLFCGCTQNSAVKLVQPGTNIVFNNGHYVLQVARRDGSTIGGVKITITDPKGLVTIMTSDEGKLTNGPKTNSIHISLLSGQVEKAGKFEPLGRLEMTLSR